MANHPRMLVTLGLTVFASGCMFGPGLFRDVSAQAAPPPPWDQWEPIVGHWEVTDGAYCQKEPGKAQHCYALTAVSDPVLITVEATPTAPNALDFASFGFVIQYLDKANWAAIRLGSYGGVSLVQVKDGVRTIRRLGAMTVEVGRTYRLAVAYRDDRAGVFVDGELRYVLASPWPGRQGRIGLFTECACRFDNFRTHRDRDALAAHLAATEPPRPGATAPPAIRDGVFEDTFANADAALWTARTGHWTVANGRYELRSRESGRYMAQAPVLVTEGAIAGTATPLAPSTQKVPRPVFGVLAKWIDSANWAAVRCGEYGSISGLVTQNGQLKVIGLGEFVAEMDRCYAFRVEMAGTQVKTFCDGRELPAFEAPFASQPGRVGLYTEAPAAFDDVRIEGAAALPERQPKPFTGTPRLELAFAEFRPAGDTASVTVPTAGGVYLYVRNTGTGPAHLRRLLVNGQDADRQKTAAWYRQRPDVLPPGQMGQVLVRLHSLPRAIGLKLFEAPEATSLLPVAVETWGGDTLHAQVPVRGKPPRFQINCVAFDPPLRRLFAYVQQAPSCRDGVLHLTQVLLDGRDVTAHAAFGQRSMNDGVVPIVVDLPDAVRAGQPVTLCIGTEEGLWTGHAVRAFPGKFHIQVTLLGKQPRPDAIDDIWRHGATCVGLCGASPELLLRAKVLGLEHFHYGRGGLGAVRSFDQPRFPPLRGMWLDEMDKLPVRCTFDAVQESVEAYAAEDKFIPLQMVNLCSNHVPQAVDYYELADATCGAYGFFGGALGDGFGRTASLSGREYRLARLPFMPYFRDAEMPVVIAPATHGTVGRGSKYRRCIEPREERWMTYGCLLQGAKGILHWAYGADINPPPNWFSQTETVIRAGMGGALGHTPHGYEIPADQALELQRTWDEIGRINVELQAVGPLVAVSDVSTLAQVTRVTPASSPTGEPAAAAAALVSGLDTIVLVVLNHNLKHNWKADADRGIESYDPVDATVELRLPSWLKGLHTFRVRHTGVEPVSPAREDGRLMFRFDTLEVAELVVVTDRTGLRESVQQTVAELNARQNRTGP